MTKISLYQEHLKRWSEGCGSCLCSDANRLVFARGRIPCDVLFIGEAPGESENVIGRPFLGPAGKLLDHIVNKSLPAGITSAFTNLVCCIPREEDSSKKATEPPDEAILDCQPRLAEFIEIANPRLIVCVGALARDYLDPQYRHGVKLHRKTPIMDIKHPSAILRASVVHKGMMVQQCIVSIRNAVIYLEERL